MIIKKTVLDRLFAPPSTKGRVSGQPGGEKRFDYSAFKQQEQPKPHSKADKPPQQAETAQVKELQPIEEINKSERKAIEHEIPKLERWDITELEHCFATVTLPTVPVKLNDYTTIADISKFMLSHLAIVQANNGNKTFLPYLDRMKELQQFLFLLF